MAVATLAPRRRKRAGTTTQRRAHLAESEGEDACAGERAEANARKWAVKRASCAGKGIGPRRFGPKPNPRF